MLYYTTSILGQWQLIFHSTQRTKYFEQKNFQKIQY